MTDRVVHFTDAPVFGGAEQAILTLIDGLDRTRWESVLVHHPSDAVRPLADGAAARGVPTKSVPRMDPGVDGARHIPRFVRDLRRLEPTIFHAHLTWPLASQYALLGSWLARSPGIVATVQLHVDLSLSARVDAQQRLLTRVVDRYLAVSDDVRRRLVHDLRWPASKIEVVHNSIDAPRFRRPRSAAVRSAITADAAAPLVLAPARLERQKGHEYLLAAAARLPEVHVAIAGDGSRRHELEAIAHDLGIADRVRFLGERRDIPDLLAASDVVVLPSLAEGLPLALLEAMAAGIPVVASAIGGVDELVVAGETGLLVPVGDVDALAAAIRRVVADRPYARALAENARRRIDAHFSAEAMRRRVERIYEEVSTGR